MTPDKPKELSRRRFLGSAGLAGAGAAIAGGAQAQAERIIAEVQPWTRELGDGVDKRPYGQPSPFEKHVVRRTAPWLYPSPETGINFTPLHEIEGVITPSGLCFERHHGGIAEIDPAQHRLMIHGLVEKPLVFTLDDLKRMPRVSRACFCECTANSGMEWRGPQMNGVQFTHGMIHNVMHSGVTLRTVLEEAGLKPSARWLLLEGADAAAMTRSLPIEKALDDCLLAFAMNGEEIGRASCRERVS
jgi:sulfane dehydrogenase subunit SoxC